MKKRTKFGYTPEMGVVFLHIFCYEGVTRAMLNHNENEEALNNYSLKYIQ